MKKILSVLLVVAMVMAIVACGGNNTTKTSGSTQGTQGTTTNSTTNTTGTTGTTGTTATTGTTGGNVVVNPGFDEDNIAFMFGAISDIHLEKNKTYSTEAKFSSALAQLLAFADDRGELLNAVAIVGDICETKEQIETFKNIYEGMSMPGELIFGLGNHDQEYTYSKQALTLQDFKDVLGDQYFGNKENDLKAGNRHFEIDGQHFIYVQPESYATEAGNRVTFSASTITWLDGKLNEITTANPNAYVYVLVHAMIYDTCYGSTLAYAGGVDDNSSYWFTTDLTPTLSKYPQVMTFSGHLHFPLNDERSIMQDKFTSIGTGSVAYLAIENGYTNTSSATTPVDPGATSVGQVVEIDVHGNVRITRLNFSTGKQMGDAWILNAPTADGSHLKTYGKDRADANKAPSMSGSEIVVNVAEVSALPGSFNANFTFAAGTDDSFVHHYVIKVTNTEDNTVFKNVKYLTDFWKNTDPADMAKSVTFDLGAVIAGKTYKVEVTAVDSWGATATIEKTFTVPTGGVMDSKLPDALVDVDFKDDGTMVDTKGNATVTLHNGATVGAIEVGHNGVKKTLTGLNLTAKGQHGLIALSGYDLAAMQALYNGSTGFSFEAFYVNRAPASTQGVMCATQFGGLGMADSGSGVPGLCLYTTDDNNFHYTKGSTKASTEELVHVVTTTIVFNNNVYSSVYVNGELTDSQTRNNAKIYMTSASYAKFAYNKLSLGADAQETLNDSTFNMTNFTMVDAKIYSVALNPEQVKTAYNAAKALFN